ncbi:LysR substrate-binding domain-containing protein [Afifella aestuarii]|uniref:LysR substrate-binding domain-containing protein n=1 Tax=Afifella aestuarii TaxID=1909496 RepID=UPI000FE3C659|nr:LysR substrate-binding domain-containing protein [Afifella aestuarii]
MNLQQLAAFRAVMMTGTVSGAAEVLGRSQPAVSRMLDRLEADLGLTLFERRKGLIMPMPQARRLLDEVERAYVSLDSLQALATRLAKGQGDQVNLAILPALGLSFMPRVIARFRDERPGTRVSLAIRMSPTVEEWAAGQQVDFGFAEMPVRRTGFDTEIFSDSPYVAAVPSDHDLADRSCLGPTDLAKGPLIYWTPFVAARHLLDQALITSGVRVEALCETSLSGAAYEMVKQGLGIAVIDPYTAILQRDDRIRLIPFRPAIPFSVALLRPQFRAATPAVERMLELAKMERDKVLAEVPS